MSSLGERKGKVPPVPNAKPPPKKIPPAIPNKPSTVKPGIKKAPPPKRTNSSGKMAPPKKTGSFVGTGLKKTSKADREFNAKNALETLSSRNTSSSTLKEQVQILSLISQMKKVQLIPKEVLQSICQLMYETEKKFILSSSLVALAHLSTFDRTRMLLSDCYVQRSINDLMQVESDKRREAQLQKMDDEDVDEEDELATELNQQRREEILAERKKEQEEELGKKKEELELQRRTSIIEYLVQFLSATNEMLRMNALNVIHGLAQFEENQWRLAQDTESLLPLVAYIQREVEEKPLLTKESQEKSVRYKSFQILRNVMSNRRCLHHLMVKELDLGQLLIEPMIVMLHFKTDIVTTSDLHDVVVVREDEEDEEKQQREPQAPRKRNTPLTKEEKIKEESEKLDVVDEKKLPSFSKYILKEPAKGSKKDRHIDPNLINDLLMLDWTVEFFFEVIYKNSDDDICHAMTQFNTVEPLVKLLKLSYLANPESVASQIHSRALLCLLKLCHLRNAYRNYIGEANGIRLIIQNLKHIISDYQKKKSSKSKTDIMSDPLEMIKLKRLLRIVQLLILTTEELTNKANQEEEDEEDDENVLNKKKKKKEKDVNFKKKFKLENGQFIQESEEVDTIDSQKDVEIDLSENKKVFVKKDGIKFILALLGYVQSEKIRDLLIRIVGNVTQVEGNTMKVLESGILNTLLDMLEKGSDYELTQNKQIAMQEQKKPEAKEEIETEEEEDEDDDEYETDDEEEEEEEEEDERGMSVRKYYLIKAISSFAFQPDTIKKLDEFGIIDRLLKLIKERKETVAVARMFARMNRDLTFQKNMYTKGKIDPLIDLIRNGDDDKGERRVGILSLMPFATNANGRLILTQEGVFDLMRKIVEEYKDYIRMIEEENQRKIRELRKRQIEQRRKQNQTEKTILTEKKRREQEKKNQNKTKEEIEKEELEKIEKEKPSAPIKKFDQDVYFMAEQMLNKARSEHDAFKVLIQKMKNEPFEIDFDALQEIDRKLVQECQEKVVALLYLDPEDEGDLDLPVDKKRKMKKLVKFGKSFRINIDWQFIQDFLPKEPPAELLKKHAKEIKELNEAAVKKDRKRESLNSSQRQSQNNISALSNPLHKYLLDRRKDAIGIVGRREIWRDIGTAFEYLLKAADSLTKKNVVLQSAMVDSQGNTVDDDSDDEEALLAQLLPDLYGAYSRKKPEEFSRKTVIHKILRKIQSVQVRIVDADEGKLVLDENKMILYYDVPFSIEGDKIWTFKSIGSEISKLILGGKDLFEQFEGLDKDGEVVHAVDSVGRTINKKLFKEPEIDDMYFQSVEDLRKTAMDSRIHMISDIGILIFHLDVTDDLFTPSFEEMQAIIACKQLLNDEELFVKGWPVVKYNKNGVAQMRFFILTTNAYYTASFDMNKKRLDYSHCKCHPLNDFFLMDVGILENRTASSIRENQNLNIFFANKDKSQRLYHQRVEYGLNLVTREPPHKKLFAGKKEHKFVDDETLMSELDYQPSTSRKNVTESLDSEDDPTNTQPKKGKNSSSMKKKKNIVKEVSDVPLTVENEGGASKKELNKDKKADNSGAIKVDQSNNAEDDEEEASDNTEDDLLKSEDDLVSEAVLEERAIMEGDIARREQRNERVRPNTSGMYRSIFVPPLHIPRDKQKAYLQEMAWCVYAVVCAMRRGKAMKPFIDVSIPRHGAKSGMGKVASLFNRMKKIK